MFQYAAIRVEAALLHGSRLRLTTGYTGGQGAELIQCIVGQAQRTADIAECALRAIADHGRRQRSTRAAVFVENVLDHFLAAFVLEIDVDIGRLVALLRQEALEQQVAFSGSTAVMPRQ